MTLKRIFAVTTVLVVALSALLIVAAMTLLSTETALQNEILYQKDAILLSHTMSQSSQSLTNDIRQYAMTGDISYRKSYFNTLDISSGKAPRPDGTVISFKDMVKKMGLTSEENDNILNSNDYSMNLVKLETEVMNYIDAWLVDHPGNDLKSGGDIDLQLQQVRLFDRGYMDEIDKIMNPVNRFQSLLMKRVDTQVEAAHASVQSMELLFLLTMALMILAVIAILTFLSRSIVGNLKGVITVLDKMAVGNLSERFLVKSKDEFAVVSASLGKVSDSVSLLIADAGMLAEAAVDGKLATRADASKHEGDYRKVVDGVNKTLDLVITPFNETSAVLKRMAEGDLTT
ncbi:MAG: HAMP domain-containing protein, partial [Spirochaetota bacterium]